MPWVLTEQLISVTICKSLSAFEAPEKYKPNDCSQSQPAPRPNFVSSSSLHCQQRAQRPLGLARPPPWLKFCRQSSGKGNPLQRCLYLNSVRSLSLDALPVIRTLPPGCLYEPPQVSFNDESGRADRVICPPF